MSAKVGTGRHTTSDPRLIPLPGGGAVVNTAGVRTFHLPRMDRAELEAGFPEIAAAAARVPLPRVRARRRRRVRGGGRRQPRAARTAIAGCCTDLP